MAWSSTCRTLRIPRQRRSARLLPHPLPSALSAHRRTHSDGNLLAPRTLCAACRAINAQGAARTRPAKALLSDLPRGGPWVRSSSPAQASALATPCSTTQAPQALCRTPSVCIHSDTSIPAGSKLNRTLCTIASLRGAPALRAPQWQQVTRRRARLQPLQTLQQLCPHTRTLYWCQCIAGGCQNVASSVIGTRDTAEGPCHVLTCRPDERSTSRTAALAAVHLGQPECPRPQSQPPERSADSNGQPASAQQPRQAYEPQSAHI